MITDMFTEINIITLNALASLAILTTSKKTITSIIPTQVMMFISVNMSVIILRETSAQWYKPKYKSPLYPWIQIFGIITGFFLLFYLGLMPFLAIGAIFLIGAIIYAFS